MGGCGCAACGGGGTSGALSAYGLTSRYGGAPAASGCPGGVCSRPSSGLGTTRDSGALPVPADISTWTPAAREAFYARYIVSLEADETERRRAAGATMDAAEQGRIRSAAQQTAAVELARRGITDLASIINAENTRAELAAARMMNDALVRSGRTHDDQQRELERAFQIQLAGIRGTTQGLTTTPPASVPWTNNEKLAAAAVVAVLVALYLKSQKKGRR